MYGNDVIMVHFKYVVLCKKKPKFIPIIETNIEATKCCLNEFLQKSDKPI